MRIRTRIISIVLAAVLLVASMGAVGCQPNSNNNGNSNGGGSSNVDKLFVGLRLALAGSGPLLALLVSQGKLSEQKAGFIRKDFGDAVDITDELKNDVAAATDTAGKLAAAQKAYHAFRLIYERGNYGSDPTMLTAANIADGVFQAIVELFGGHIDSAIPHATAPMSEAEKRAAIEAKIEDLKVALAVK